MNGNETVPGGQPSSATSATRPIQSPAPRRTRWSALLCTALLASACITYVSGTATYEERLADIAASRGLSKEAYEAAGSSAVLKELFLDAADDRELTLKLELGLLKYADRARAVIEMFGDDPQFQEVLRQHGEGVIPIIDYFMSTDLLTLKGRDWALGKLQEFLAAISKVNSDKGSGSTKVDPIVYGPRSRGIYAIEAIRMDGHHFLGQFVLDPSNHIQRVQTDHILETLKKILAGGVTDLEWKYRSGARIEPTDVAWAGADVLSVFGATKALKFLGQARISGKAVEEAAVVRRTTVMGRSVLLGEAVGRRIARVGAKAAAVYLVVRHPGLLSGVFGALGQLVGLPAWLSILIGWWGAAALAMLAIIPVLRGATLLISPIRWIASAAVWMLPTRSQVKPSPI